MSARAYIAGCVVALTLCASALGEVYADRPAQGHDGTNIATPPVTRRIVINGITTLGRSWTVREHLDAFASREIAASKARKLPVEPRVQLDASGLTLVEFHPAKAGDPRMDTATARVVMARPDARHGHTSVWVAQIPMETLLAEARDRMSGVSPGRDHPWVGPIAGARRVNVVEVLDPGYSYSAVYATTGAPSEVQSALVAQLVARGARVDGQTTGLADSRAALTLNGGRIDFSVMRNPDNSGSRIVIQTDIPPNLQALGSR